MSLTIESQETSVGEIINDFEQCTRGLWSATTKYQKVTALLISWLDDDLGVDKEVDRLELLFKHEFRYETERYHIPSSDSAAELSYRLSTFIKDHALDTNVLSIFYYAGHGDNTAEGTAGYPEWRAKRDGGPTLGWFTLQSNILNANGDVLVLLDCCHAATKTQGFFKHGQMEILAASSSGSRVPKPGRVSFTSVLMREVWKQITAGKDVPIRWLQRHLWDSLTQPALTESPQYFPLAKDDLPTIRLAPLPSPVPAGFARKHEPPSSFALLSISFREDPKGKQLADWLASYPPNIVSSVSIEGLVLKARLLQGLGADKDIFTGSILGSLSNSTQGEILAQIKSLSHTMSTSDCLAQAIASDRLGAGNPGDQLADMVKAKTLSDIDQKVCALAETIEDGILLETDINLSCAEDDQIVAVCGADKTISLRQRLISSSFISEQLELPRRSIVWASSLRRGSRNTQSRLRIGRVNGHAIIAETFKYELLAHDVEAEGPLPNQLQQLKKMAAQLCHPKSNNFHILPGLGYIHEQSANSFSLLFDLATAIDSDQDKTGASFVTLLDHMSKQKRVPLGHRIRLAFALAEAMENFHKVGWVHKSFKSNNVVLFPKSPKRENSDEPMVDVDHPWLFGFEYSRPEDAETDLKTNYSAETNAYMHPERWGKPLARFSKAHDVYSLGVIMLEIAYWKPILQFSELKQQCVDPDSVKAAFLQRVRGDGPHMCGEKLSKGIEACLTFKELVEGRSDLEAHKMFRERILDQLKNVGTNI
ncbi:unnamed protein product [Alternaria alternata]